MRFLIEVMLFIALLLGGFTTLNTFVEDCKSSVKSSYNVEPRIATYK